MGGAINKLLSNTKKFPYSTNFYVHNLLYVIGFQSLLLHKKFIRDCMLSYNRSNTHIFMYNC